MQLQVGDKLSDESGEWEVIGHPYATAGGKSTNVRVQRVDKPGVTESDYGAFTRVTVMRGRSRAVQGAAREALRRADGQTEA